jgi:septum formation protein
LEQVGILFDVVPADVEELEDGSPEKVAVENARRKAAAVAREVPDAAVLGVDTVVAVGERLYGKPAAEGSAAETLRALSDRSHVVTSGLCLMTQGHRRTAAVSTTVSFRPLDEALIDWYLHSGEWRGRAGGYAIQGRGAALVERIEGDYLNVVGLPLAALLELAPALLYGS